MLILSSVAHVVPTSLCFGGGPLILRVGRIHPLQNSLCWAEDHLQCREKSLCSKW